MRMDCVEAINSQQIFGDKRVNFSNTLPPSPVDKDLWFEPSFAPQPWEYDGGSSPTRWRSQPVTNTISLPSNTSMASSGTTSAFRIGVPMFTPLSTDSIWWESANLLMSVRSPTTITTTSDFITGTLIWVPANATSTTNNVNNSGGTLATTSTSGVAVGSYRRLLVNIYQYFAFPLFFGVTISRSGTTTPIVVEISLSITFKYVRANA